MDMTFYADGQAFTARTGETIAGALTRQGIREFHRSLNGSPRGLFCGIGVCHDCHATVDGRAQMRTCLILVSDGMRVETR
jgi:predicted molibdopterin-dependent oxidoreductase YjgC